MGCPECDRLGTSGCWHIRSTGREATADLGDTSGASLRLHAAALYDQQLHILLEKNRDYSPLNVSMAPFGVIQGLLTRISDKYWRAVNLVSTGSQANFESLEDTFGDLQNYAAISTLCLRGQWPGVSRGGIRA